MKGIMRIQQTSLVILEQWRTASWRGRISLLRLISMSLLALWPSGAPVHAQVSFSSPYQWQTGPWEECRGEACGAGGTQVRKVWCEHVEGWTTLRSNCLQAEQGEAQVVSERPASQRECFHVCEEHRGLATWNVGQWRPCEPRPDLNTPSLGPVCGIDGLPGWKKRDVVCTWKDNGTEVLDMEQLCRVFDPRPSDQESCTAACPRDCVASEFSAWSPCERPCGADSGLQYRTRTVLVPPEFGGALCPNLTEVHSCRDDSACDGGDGGFKYSLRVGPWSDCRPARIGRFIRDVRHNAEPNGTNFSRTTKAEMLNKTAPDFPVNGTSTGLPREGIELKRWTKEQWRSTPHDWPRGGSPWDVQIGYQSRQVRCIRSDGKSAPLTLCLSESPSPAFQPCLLPRDCVVTEWSSWSPCSRTCRGPEGGAAAGPGVRSRSRSVRASALGGGQVCPPLIERENCSEEGGETLTPCPRFVWKVAQWSECRVELVMGAPERRRANHTGLCGGGLRTRDVYCIMANENLILYLNSLHERQEMLSKSKMRPTVAPSLSISYEISASRPVDSSLCGVDKPETLQACSVPCPAECRLTPWTAWGPCTFENCGEAPGKKGFKRRRRRIVREAAGGGGGEGDCTHLAEVLPCDDPACFRWEVAGVGACFPDGGARCGTGERDQLTVCRKDTGEQASRELCSGRVEPPAKLPCRVPCPGDCVLAHWSDWSPCSFTCSGKSGEGRQSRGRAVLAHPSDGGAPCTGEGQELLEWQPCAQVPCTVYHWQAGSWGPCTEDLSTPPRNASLRARPAPAGGSTRGTPPAHVGVSSSPHDGPSCSSSGIQSRKVICMRIGIGQVGTKKCPEKERPNAVRPCVLLCRKDCITTPFSDWSSCPATCQERGGSPKKQRRWRMVIQQASHGGKECPQNLQEERDCQDRPPCHAYKWKAHRWRPCQLAPDYVRRGIPGADEACGPGLQTRAVTCRQEDGSQVDPELCLASAGAPPAPSQACRVPCGHECSFSAWSRFSPCSGGCGSTRSRRRSLLGKSRRVDKCKDLELYPQVDTQTCPCREYSARPVGPWSDCLLPEGRGRSRGPASPPRETGDCGQGTRYRALACYDQQGRLVEGGNCASPVHQEESCVVACPSDCRLSEWSGWSPCSKSCGSGVKVRSKWLREKPFNGGRPCPKLDHTNQVYEVVPCHMPCQQHVWVAGPWGACNASGAVGGCGESSAGEQVRQVRCTVNTPDGPSEVADAQMCDPEAMPAVHRSCWLPCPWECVLSEWGPWAACVQPYNSSMARMRTRSVLRPAAPGATCAALNESEPCALDKNYFHHQYNLTEWSTCQLSEKAVCGVGVVTRMLDCARSDGKSVDLDYCQEKGLESPWRLAVPCTVPCPVNCQLSEWSPWSLCSRTCGLAGVIRRERRVVRPAQGDGRRCSPQLQQSKPCPVLPCYRWEYGQWSGCLLQDAQCGEGVQVRNVSCVVTDGLTNDSAMAVEEDDKCGERQDVPDGEAAEELQRACSVPCPGDCRLGKWSDWSVCQLMCATGSNLGLRGVQARSRVALGAAVPESRAACPAQVWESRPCDDGKCFQYQWRSGPWRGTEREVWCARSDGINVTGMIVIVVTAFLQTPFQSMTFKMHSTLNTPFSVLNTGGCLASSEPPRMRSCQPPCPKPNSFCTQTGTCECARGFSRASVLGGTAVRCERVTLTAGAGSGGSGSGGGGGEHRADVVAGHGAGRSRPDVNGDTRLGDVLRTWSMQPYGPDGKLKVWVYGVSAAACVLLTFIVSMIYLACKRPKRPIRRPVKRPSPRRPVTLTYDGDIDL
uniref:Thrombospondin type-1 domain-containing protein 7A n=1 Tax=Petromyzon marinus TaxID=7757 RepID=A0AAJ7WL50_PETMA|nr:thrombospondin type-1 domain-containing protein 7A-like isoform X2 [Petromyzon marinus]